MATVLRTNTGGTLRTLCGGARTFGKPTAPRNLSVTVGDSQATLTWQPPLTDGGDPITGYSVTATPTTGSTVTGTTTAGVLTKTLTLTNGVSYGLTVAALNGQGTGTPSTPFRGTPTFGGTVVKPTAATTGCRIARGSLTPITGAALEAATDGSSPTRSWVGYLVTGNFLIRCDDFVMTDCIVEPTTPGALAYYMIRGIYHARSQITHCTIDGKGVSTAYSPDTAVELGPQGVLDSCDIKGCIDGVHESGSGQITDNYVHGNVAPTGAHSDAIQVFSTVVSGLYIARNNFDPTDSPTGTVSISSAMQFGGFAAGATVNNLTVEDNWFNCGAYTINGNFGSAAVAGVTIRRNRFGLNSSFGPVTPAITHGTPAVSYWNDPTNVWDVSGTTPYGHTAVADQPWST